jgi:hypothetical protein
MTTDTLSWPKAKDALIVGAAGLIVYLALQILVDVGSIQVALAKYQAGAEAVEKRVERLERIAEGTR